MATEASTRNPVLEGSFWHPERLPVVLLLFAQVGKSLGGFDSGWPGRSDSKRKASDRCVNHGLQAKALARSRAAPAALNWGVRGL